MKFKNKAKIDQDRKNKNNHQRMGHKAGRMDGCKCYK